METDQVVEVCHTLREGNGGDDFLAKKGVMSVSKVVVIYGALRDIYVLLVSFAKVSFVCLQFFFYYMRGKRKKTIISK